MSLTKILQHLATGSTAAEISADISADDLYKFREVLAATSDEIAEIRSLLTSAQKTPPKSVKQ